ncbi:AfsR/SARP family transcriptional regulator [Streptomyces sp. NBC_01264]|uniref:AfsR/SARP family transcriptional regulator n=1 Tax=Streptomyces sp. NBC_01264 TaxID=2903804 RepID=UPI00225A2FF7|nr:BTAD domain-containing putative transcriptional regulator [Streptomyces sp. NBC_01264]MCX4778558.1 tetratricopeptide repeat protein [Streptomyces sp. NBC_01264]
MTGTGSGKDGFPSAQEPRFLVLGSLEVWASGVRVRLGGTIQERVLATLLLEPGRVVPIARLVEAAWEEDPPATASHQVRKAVADLRRRLPSGGKMISTDGPGYRVITCVSQLDLLDFNARIQTAAQAVGVGRLNDACAELQGALDLWRGPVLAGEGGPVIGRTATALEERRLAAAEQLHELRLELGASSELVASLRALVDAHPLRETLRGQLMLALYRSGRQADALAEYGKVRELLADELGIDPGSRLVKLYEGILRESPELTAPQGEPPAAASAMPAEQRGPVSTLPYALPDFTGRDKELAILLSRVRAERLPGEHGARVAAIDGMGGAGKTSLAVRAAHMLTEEFPDGQLYVDLRGFTPGEQLPVPASTALDILLRAIGTPSEHIPEDLPGRTVTWGSALAGRRMLLLLDNASDAAQIQPLLAAPPGCLVLITSRVRLLDLDGIEWISLGLMPPEDSATLVARTLGPARVEAEPEAATELAELCGHLPLALRIATARLRNRPRWTVRHLVERLQDESRRMDELSSGERSVAATLQLSYLAMDNRHRAAFRALGLHPGDGVDAHSAAALLDTGVRDAEDILELLLDVHLLQQPGLGEYTFHDLVRSFAQSQHGPMTEQTDADAVERLLNYYLTATNVACDVLFPGRAARSTGIPRYQGELPKLADEKTVSLWFRREHQRLLAVVDLSDRLGYDRHTGWLVRDLVFHLNAGGYFEEFRALGRLAVQAARRLDDPVLLSISLASLGAACWKLGYFEEGINVAREGREIAVRLGDRDAEANSESTLGLLQSMLGRYNKALPLLEHAVELARELGTARVEAETQTILSSLYARWGRYPEAAASALQALELERDTANSVNETMALADLAFAQLGMGQYVDAEATLRRARELCDESAPQGDVALVLALSAEVAHRLGYSHAASELADRAQILARSGGTPVRQAKAENVLGRLHTAQGQYASATALHAHALEVASAIQFRSEQASAYLGLARAAEGLGDGATAGKSHLAAAELFDLMEIPEAGRSH